MDIFVINLARRQDRWHEISNHLTSLGLDFARVEAIDGLMLDENHCSLVPRAVDACWQSHQKVFALVAQKPGKNCLVLEDDATLNADVNWARLLNTLDEYIARASIDVLQLGFIEPTSNMGFDTAVRAALGCAYHSVFSRRTIVDNRWRCIADAPEKLELVPDSFRAGTHCYVLSHRAARAFLGFNTPAFMAPDDFFVAIAQDAYHRRFKIARVKKSLAIQRSRVRGRIVDSDLWPES